MSYDSPKINVSQADVEALLKKGKRREGLQILSQVADIGRGNNDPATIAVRNGLRKTAEIGKKK